MKHLDLYILLDKDKLNSSEEEFLSKLCNEDPEKKRIVDIYKSIKNISTNASHLSIDTLSEYVLYKNNDDSEKLFLPKLTPIIEDHLRKCELCKNAFVNLNEEFAKVNSFIEDKFNTAKGKKSTQVYSNTNWWNLQNNSNIKRFVYSMVALFLVYFSLFTFYNVTIPEYKKDFVVISKNINSITRGRISSEFQKGIVDLDRHNFDSAIKNLISDIEENSNDKTIFYTYFVLGKTYLEASKSNVFGLYTNYDENNLHQSISAFNNAIEKNINPEFKHLNYDANYFIARSLLLLDKQDEAKKYLNKVIKNKGSFIKDAEILLKSLES